MLLEKYKEKRIMVAGFVVAFIGSLMLAIIHNYLSAIVSLFLIGSGMAMLQVVINPLLRTAGGEEHYAFNSVLAQLIFGAASFVSPKVYSYFAQNLKGQTSGLLGLFSKVVPRQLPWISLYWIFAVIALVMIVIIRASRFPVVELKADEEVGPLGTHLMLFRKRVVVLFFIAMICYVGTEQGIANWISKFLETYHHYNPETKGADTVAYFWGWMTIGGIVGLFLLKVLDSRKVLIGFTIAALISLSVAFFRQRTGCADRFSGRRFLRIGDVPDYIFTGVKLHCRTPRIVCRHNCDGDYRRGDRSADHRRTGRCVRFENRHVLPVYYAGLYP